MEETPDPRPAVSLYWFFTWNNYEEERIHGFLDKVGRECDLYCIQEEVGAGGTPHLQGKIKLKKRSRPVQLFGIREIHWEKSAKWKGWQYCAKNETHVGRRWASENIEIPQEISVQVPYGWQLDILSMLDSEPDQRKIYWFWESEGGVGKSSLVKFLCVKKGATMFGGTAADAKCGIALMKKKPSIVIMDIPRSTEHVSYAAMEEIKNGCFFSSKYESGMVVFNTPHVLIFANREPEYEKLSSDRWVVTQIKANKN